MAKQSPTVVLDPGHGGSAKVGGSSSNNASGPNGLLEKDVALDVARRVGVLLGDRATVVLTRSGDENRSLVDRARIARDADADVFLSIHFNGWTTPDVDGTEAWVAKSSNGGSHELAHAVLGRVTAVTRAPDRGVREADLGVLLPARQGAHTAASLLEVAFLTNPQEAERLARDDYRQSLAQAIADGIVERLPAAAPAPAAAAFESATCATGVSKLALTQRAVAYAHPLFDTGEHVQTGGDLYEGRLIVGPSPGVAFSYGELISMGDLYGSVEDMMKADLDELTRLKTLIDRSTAYYAGGKKDKSLDVSDDEWDRATGGTDTKQGRYLKLAEENYEHFSPNTLFTDSIAQGLWRGTNQSTWEMYHRQAIHDAQDLALAPENQGVSYFPMGPLIVNAFGDHFLTDAFASGHLINKELMIAYFKANFFSGDSLNGDADDFFDRVAKAAWHSPVSDEFSKLEEAHWHFLFGFIPVGHPNIDSVGRFKTLLTLAAEQQPERIANFAVKALHDKLNEEGVEVVNAAGDMWRLFGDGHLNTPIPENQTLSIMSKAVRQSADNIVDPSILVSDLDVQPFLDKVWQYVPRLTTDSAPLVKSLILEYTNPKSTVLSDAAAALIEAKLKELIKTLKELGKLRDA